MSTKQSVAMAALQGELKEVTQRSDEWRKKCDEERTARYAAKQEIKEVRQQFADLKERLANAESSNQYMRGYIARLQEDDVVREELVTTGDPDGEQIMRPKRKHAQFERPSDYREIFQNSGATGSLEKYRTDSDRPKPKHWVTY